MTTKKFYASLIGASALLMGLSMPSCPGQHEMQEQLSAIKNTSTELETRVSALESQNKALKEELEQNKNALTQLTASVTDHSQAIEQLKVATATPPPTPTPIPPATKKVPAKAKSKRK